MPIPTIQCSSQNHYKMPFEFICTHPLCLKNTQQLACIYCCQQLHDHHMDKIQALKTVLIKVQESTQSTQFGAAQALLKGVYSCKTEEQLRRNITQMLAYQNGCKKYGKVIDQKNVKQKEQVKKFYKDRNETSKLIKTIKKSPKIIQTQATSFIYPILTFQSDDSQGIFNYVSPFCISNPSENLTTAFAYPALNRFEDSVETQIQILKITPFWLGIGLSVGKKKYDTESKNHILLTSNGWINVFGKLTQTNVKYFTKDTVKVKYDKRLNIVQFQSNSERQTVNLDVIWQQDIYVCCVLFYKDDSVQIMS